MRFGPDLSNYQSQFSAEDAQKLAAKECTFAFIGRQKNNTWAAQQREYLRSAGITHIAEYLISLRGEWPKLFDDTKYVAVDIEPGSEFITEVDIDNAIAWIISEDRTPLIYSASWAWDAVGLTGVTKYAEKGIPLWNAHYDGRTDGFVLPTPFGGWVECAVDQYTASWDDGGLGYPIDMNTCVDSLFIDVQTSRHDSVTEAYKRGVRDGRARQGFADREAVHKALQGAILVE
jgi:hypothetical protein